jgi:hypothetical protein
VEELADDAAHEADRQEHRARSQRGGQHRQADLVGAVARRVVVVLPICTWRTMFSRTTMASSISRPTHRLSAIIVMKLIVKPKAYMNRKVPISAIGSVSPVMTVLRQLLQEQEDDAHRQQRAFDQRALDVGHRHADGRELSRLTSASRRAAAAA